MSSYDTKRTVLECINEARKLLGFNEITRLDQDRQSKIAVQMLNVIIAMIASPGDWQELYKTVTVTASTGVSDYSLGITHPIKNIFEISFYNDRQALYPLVIEDFNRLQRSNTTGRPRQFTIKGVDNQGNPKFSVYPSPSTQYDGKTFVVAYYRKPAMYDISSADDEIIFPANLVIQGLYAKMLEEEQGGVLSREAINAYNDFNFLLREELNKYNANSGSGSQIHIVPAPFK